METPPTESPQEIRAEKRTYRFFEVGVILKGINAAMEVAGGLLALMVPPSVVLRLTDFLTSYEVGVDPDDWIAHSLRHLAQEYALGGRRFVALYLLSHGVVKLLLVVGLLRNERWAYPASLAVFGCFVGYQTYLLTGHFSYGVAALTVMDLAVMWFIWREYRIVRRHADKETPAA